MSKIHDNRESLSWDFVRLNYLKSDLGKMKFRLKENKKLFEKMFWIIRTKKRLFNTGI